MENSYPDSPENRYETIHDYDVDELTCLGMGAFAKVYLARHKKSGLEVAIKKIDRKLIVRKGMMARVKKEAIIHIQLKHPSILKLIRCLEDDMYVYLVLELCHNGDLERYLKVKKMLSEYEAQHFMKQIVVGMEFLQSCKIMHRDMKLANLLLTKNMEVKIADFGLATKLNEPEEKHFTMCGTPNYMAPEVASGSGHDLKADVWSLGIMLHIFLVGTHPFGTDTFKTIQNRRKEDIDLSDNLSPEAKDLIQKLLKNNPSQRISLHDIMKHPFMLKEDIAEYQKGNRNNTVVSIDSGQGTMSTGMISRMSNVPKQHPMKAIHYLQGKLPESHENSLRDTNTSEGYHSDMSSRKELPPMTSPSVRHLSSSPSTRLHSCERDQSRQLQHSNNKSDLSICSNKVVNTSNHSQNDRVTRGSTLVSDRSEAFTYTTPKSNHMEVFAYKVSDPRYHSVSKQWTSSESDVMKHPFMLKEDTAEYQKGNRNNALVSIDSGQGTMSTGMISRMSNVPKQHPMKAIHYLQGKLPESHENSLRDTNTSEGYHSDMSSRKELPPMTSPSVRHLSSSPSTRLHSCERDQSRQLQHSNNKSDLLICSNKVVNTSNHSQNDRVTRGSTPVSDRSEAFTYTTPKSNHMEVFAYKVADPRYNSAHKQWTSSESDVMKHPFMLKEDTAEYQKGNRNNALVSIDSGQGTMSTGMISRMSNVPKQHPMKAIHYLQGKLPESHENSLRDTNTSEGYHSDMSSRKELPPMTSPSVRHLSSSPSTRLHSCERDQSRQLQHSNNKSDLSICSNKVVNTSNHSQNDRVTRGSTPVSDRSEAFTYTTPKSNHMEAFAYKVADPRYNSAHKQWTSSESDVMKHPFMLKEDTAEYQKGNRNNALVSIDSGQGTMSTGMISCMSNVPKQHPMKAIHYLQGKLPESHENSLRDTNTSEGYRSDMSSRKELPPMTSPSVRHLSSSPSTRLHSCEGDQSRQLQHSNNKSDLLIFSNKVVNTSNHSQNDRVTRGSIPVSDRSEAFTYTTPKSNHIEEFAYKVADPRYNSVSKQWTSSESGRLLDPRLGDAPRVNMAQFGPAKYQERFSTPSHSSGRSCRASSNNAMGVGPKDYAKSNAQDVLHRHPTVSTMSDTSSIDGNKFSLLNTKKVQNFYCESPQSSLNENNSSLHSQSGKENLSNTHQPKNVDAINSKTFVHSNSFDKLDIDKPRSNFTKTNFTKNVSCKESRTHISSNDCSRKSVSGKLSDKCSPINTTRLLKSEYEMTKLGRVRISENGELILVSCKPQQEEKVVEKVFVISQDGMQIKIYCPNNGKGVPVESLPVSLLNAPFKSFTFSELPRKYWKEYWHASMYVNLIQSKTPKIIWETPKYMFKLMENADFQAVLMDEGTMFMANRKGITITWPTGTSLVLDSPDAEKGLTQERRKQLEFVKKWHAKCLQVESVLTAVQEMFPISFYLHSNSLNQNDSGKCTNTTVSASTGIDHHNSNTSTDISNKASVMTSIDNTLVSGVTNSIKKNKTQDGYHNVTLRSQSTVVGDGTFNSIVREVQVLDIGLALQYENGDVRLKCSDGTQFCVSTCAFGDFIDQNGELSTFHNTSDVVKFIWVKLPLVQELLRQEAQKDGKHHIHK